MSEDNNQRKCRRCSKTKAINEYLNSNGKTLKTCDKCQVLDKISRDKAHSNRIKIPKVKLRVKPSGTPEERRRRGDALRRWKSKGIVDDTKTLEEIYIEYLGKTNCDTCKIEYGNRRRNIDYNRETGEYLGVLCLECAFYRKMSICHGG